MLRVEVHSPSPDPSPAGHSPYISSLADLSRNASVISTSSGDSSSSSLLVKAARPRPARTFTAPSSPSRPDSPSTPRASRAPPPIYLRKEMGYAGDDPYSPPSPVSHSPPRTRAQSRVRGSRNSSANGRMTAQDFDFGEILGEGSYSTVMQARYRNTGQLYAIKVLDKAHLKRNNKLQTALAEKNVLVRLGSGHPGIVRLHSAFQDDWSLYFVLDLAPNGELQSLISRLGSLSLPCARYYAAQIVDALDYMHSKGVIHRDLKPENLLLDENFRIKITDFGTGKIIEPGVRSKTFVGTAQYVSPELLESSETTPSSDLWALGCILYQMIAGRFAFQGLSEYLTWQKIKALEYTFPEGFDPAARELVQQLFRRDPSARLGAGPRDSANSMTTLRGHEFFADVAWDTIWTDPHPPIEPGLVRKEQPAPGSGAYSDMDLESREFGWDGEDEDGEGERAPVFEDDEEDEGAREEMLGRNATRRPPDEIPWAEDAEASAYQFPMRRAEQGVGEVGYGYAGGGGGGGVTAHGSGSAADAEVGPMGEAPRYAHAFASVPIVAESAVEDDDAPADAPPQGVALPFPSTKQGSAGSADRERPASVSFSVPVAVPIPAPSVTPAPAVPGPGRGGSFSTASSSSGGSPVERLGAALMAIGLGGSRARAESRERERSRGRSRGTTPVQGHTTRPISLSASGSSDDHPESPAVPAARLGGGSGAASPMPAAGGRGDDGDLVTLLHAGETLVFRGEVEAGSLRRRASVLLLPAAVAPKKRTKTRTLVLTPRRLLCVKRYEGVKREKRAVSVKSELVFGALRKAGKRKDKGAEREADGAPERGAGAGQPGAVPPPLVKDKGREARGVITSVEARGEKGFVILTTDKSLVYATESPAVAKEWIEKIRGALDAQARERSISSGSTASRT